jgi:hypothetical protein
VRASMPDIGEEEQIALLVDQARGGDVARTTT